MDGLLVVDKPVGPTSHDVVARVRGALGERRVGHTGTLDPEASGLLLLVLGRATRLAQFLSRTDKAYDATIRLGVDTTTYDSLGRPVGAPYTGPWPCRDDVDRALDAFRGTFPQQPPAYSAKKVGGQRSYKIARAANRSGIASGAEPDQPSRPAPVSVAAAVELVSVDRDRVALRLTCSAGFYVRSLAHDLGDRLGTGAHLEALRRTRSGDMTLDDALPLAEVERDPAAARRAVVPPARMLSAFASVVLTDEGVRRAAHGRDLGPADFLGGPDARLDRERPQLLARDHPALLRLIDRRGEMVGLAEPSGMPGLLHPCVVLV